MQDIKTQVGSSINALMNEFNVITHNMANVSTAGYKRRCNSFSRVLEAQQSVADNSEGVVKSKTVFDFSQGGVAETARPLDFALNGKGFFVIESMQGELYTRNGNFNLNSNGQIVNSEGNLVAGEGGPITIPPNIDIQQMVVTGDGSIKADGVSIGKFKIVDFKENEGKLLPTGYSCYRMTDEDVRPEAATEVTVQQGYQELSNVRMVDELVDMMMVTKLYEANMKFISGRGKAYQSLIGLAMG